MPAARALLLLVAMAAFLLVGVPVQRVAARMAPRHAGRVPILFCRTLLRLLRILVIVEGEPPVGRSFLVVANHVSWIDVVALGAVQPFCFLAKSEIARWPVISAFAKVQDTVFVDRARRRSLPATNRAMAARMRAGRPTLIFPEGTTASGGVPGRFKTSHYAALRDVLRMDPSARAAVQPVAIAYSSDAAAWVGDDDLLSHLWRTLRGPPLECRLRFGAPIPCKPGFDRKEVARRSREVIVAMLSIRSRPVRPDETSAPASSSASGAARADAS